MRRLRIGRAVPVGLALVLLASSATAQEGIERHGIFLDTVNVHLINIEVVVTDKEGKPVTGLTRNDFELSVDGRPVEISNFYAVDQGKRAPAVAETATSPEVAEAVAEVPADQNLYLVLFVDNGNIAPTHRKAVFERLRDRLDSLLGPADRVMVVAQDQNLRIEQGFSADRQLVEAALDRLEKAAGSGGFENSQERYILTDISRAPGGGGGGGGAGGGAGFSGGEDAESAASRTLGSVQSYALGARERLRSTTRTLGGFISSLGGLPGRKAVLYVSDGLQLRPGELLFRAWDDKYGEAFGRQLGVSSIEAEIQGQDATDELRDLIAQANANRVAFYTIDAGGNRDLGAVSADVAGFQTGALATRADETRQESLRFLADATGGVPLLNSSNIDHLVDRLNQDFLSYYSLGYSAPAHGDGKYHKVKVSVKRPGVDVRYLEGYRDKTADERMDDRTRAALLLDVADNPLEVRLEVGDAVRQKDGKFLVPVQVKVPLAKLVLIPQEKAHVGQLSVFVMVQDEKGRMSEPTKIPLPVTIPNEKILTAMTQVAGYTARLLMRPGEQKIAVAVRDEIGAVSSTLNLQVNVGGS